MQSLAVCGYTTDEVIKALHAATRVLSFKYELLDLQNRHKCYLTNVLAASIKYEAFATIKRTIQLTLDESEMIDYLRDRIKPWVQLRMPDGGWAAWPQGVFLLTTPPREVNGSGKIIRRVEGYDLLQVLADDKVDSRYTVSANTNYIDAVKSVLNSAGLTFQNLTPTDKTLPTDRDWAPGTAKLDIINDLLAEINYEALWIDENGIAVARPYRLPTERAVEYTYRDDEQSVIFPEVSQALDLFSVPNKWVLVVSEADRDVLVSTYTNDNPNSPLSTISRGRTIVDYRTVTAADQATLDDMIRRIAYESSQVYEEVEFETAIMPFHSHLDIIELRYTRLGISYKYEEIGWEFSLSPGARMRHRARRVVSL